MAYITPNVIKFLASQGFSDLKIINRCSDWISFSYRYDLEGCSVGRVQSSGRVFSSNVCAGIKADFVFRNIRIDYDIRQRFGREHLPEDSTLLNHFGFLRTDISNKGRGSEQVGA